MHSILVSSSVMKLVGDDLGGLRNFRYFIGCITYSSKWSEAKPMTDKAAPNTAHFFYEMMCRHGCSKYCPLFLRNDVQTWLLCIKDQWLEQRICQRGVWWASSSYRCSTAGFKGLSPTTQWLSWEKKQSNKKLV